MRTIVFWLEAFGAIAATAIWLLGGFALLLNDKRLWVNSLGAGMLIALVATYVTLLTHN